MVHKDFENSEKYPSMISVFRSKGSVREGKKSVNFTFTKVWLSTSINRKKDLRYIEMEDELLNNVLSIILSRFFKIQQ